MKKSHDEEGERVGICTCKNFVNHKTLDIFCGTKAYSWQSIIKTETIEDVFEACDDTFGDMLSNCLVRKGINIPKASELLGQPLDLFENILNDKFLPWNIDTDLLVRIIQLLAIDKRTVIEAIKYHPIEEDDLICMTKKRRNVAYHNLQPKRTVQPNLIFEQFQQETLKVKFLAKLETIL